MLGVDLEDWFQFFKEFNFEVRNIDSWKFIFEEEQILMPSGGLIFF